MKLLRDQPDSYGVFFRIHKFSFATVHTHHDKWRVRLFNKAEWDVEYLHQGEEIVKDAFADFCEDIGEPNEGIK